MSETSPLPDTFRAFSSFNKFWVIHHTEQGEQILLWESRTTAGEKRVLHTIFEGQVVRVNSLDEFLLANPECLSLSIPHDVKVLWNGESQFAKLTEILSLRADRVVMKLCLVIGGTTYLTEECDSLTDAIWELDKIIGEKTEWWLQACYHCIYSRPAFLFPVSDRDEMRCYRDVPEAFEEVKRLGKFAGISALQAGHYFVDAFHACAAWEFLGNNTGVRSL